MHDSTARHVQTRLPADLHRRLRDLAYETERTLADLMLDGAVLVLKLNGRGDGLVEPQRHREDVK